MKQFFCAFIISSLLFVSCNDDKSKDSDAVSGKNDKEQSAIESGKVKDAAKDMQLLKEELSTLTPLTPDELKSKVPEQLMDAAASDVDVNAAMGATVANADYKVNDSTSLKLEIVDCAGPGGAGIFGMQYFDMINVNSDDEEEYVKTIDFNGGKAFENCKKKRNRCTIAFMSGNRFLVSLRGDNVGIDALKNVAMKLNFK
jgi:hypothetical protein